MVATTDISGTVKYYEEINESRYTTDGGILISDTQDRKSINADRGNVAAVAYKGEDQFSCPIVSCTFRSMKELGRESSMEKCVGNENPGNRCSKLLLVTAHGALVIKDADNLGLQMSSELKVSQFFFKPLQSTRFTYLSLLHVEKHRG